MEHRHVYFKKESTQWEGLVCSKKILVSFFPYEDRFDG